MKNYTNKALQGQTSETPAIVEAFVFDGTLSCWKEIVSCFTDIVAGGISYNEANNEIYLLNILSAQGNHSISKGDYIVRMNKGEYAVYKPDLFNKSFEAAVEKENSNMTNDINSMSFS